MKGLKGSLSHRGTAGAIAAGGHFVWNWDITIKFFTIHPITKQPSTNILLFSLILTIIKANKVFFSLFLVFDEIKQNVNNKDINIDVSNTVKVIL